MTKNEKFDLALLFVVSLLLSVYLFFRTYVISMDGAFQYIPMAKVFASGSFKDAIGFSGQQPLYSFLISLVSRWASDFELAGKLISSFFGILMILPVYFLGKRIFDQKIAFFSVFFLTIHPYIRRFSADVLKESSYLFFLATAIWFTLRTVQRGNKSSYLFVPFFSALAYLIRPDGIEVLLVVFFYLLFIKRFEDHKEKWTIILLLLLSSCILLLPYIIHLRDVTGEWTLSKAKSIKELLSLGVLGGEVSPVNRILFSFKKLNLEILSIFHPLYILFLAIGLIKTFSSRLKEGEKFLISFNVLHYVVLFLLVLNYTDWNAGEDERTFILSGRHVLPLLLFSIYWVGDGFLISYNWILRKLESHRLLSRLELNRRSKLIWLTLLILIVAIILPKTLKPQRYERLPEKWAGIWIRDHYGKGMTIFTTVHRVAYYADGTYEYIDLKKEGIDKIKTNLLEKKALLLVIRDKEMIHIPQRVIKKDFIELGRFEGKGMEKIIVYKRVQ